MIKNWMIKNYCVLLKFNWRKFYEDSVETDFSSVICFWLYIYRRLQQLWNYKV